MASVSNLSNVNVGTSANDGTGDSLRAAFVKVNQNFSNLYSAGQFTANITDSAALPGFTWQGDSDTGIYHPRSGEVGITLDGVPSLLVSSSNISYKGDILATRSFVLSSSSGGGGIHANVMNFGATGNGTTDDTIAIKNAIANVYGVGKTGYVYFPQGTYKISETLVLNRGIAFIGDGPGQIYKNYANLNAAAGIPGYDPNLISKPAYNATAVTVLSWGGPSEGTMIKLDGSSSGYLFENMGFTGAGSANTIIELNRVKHSVFRQLSLVNYKGTALKLAPSLDSNALINDGCSFNNFHGMQFFTAQPYAVAISLNGFAANTSSVTNYSKYAMGNSCHNNFYGMQIWGGITGVLFLDSDNNSFYATQCFDQDGNSSIDFGFEPNNLIPGSVAGTARSNYSYHLQASKGVRSYPASGAPIYRNYLYGYDRENSQPKPIESGNSKISVFGPWRFDTYETFRLANLTSTEIGNLANVANGDIVLNTTLGGIQVRVNNSWALIGNANISGNITATTDGITLQGDGTVSDPIKVKVNSVSGTTLINFSSANAIALNHVYLGTSNINASSYYTSFLTNANVATAVAFGFYDINGNIYGLGIDRNMINFVPITNQIYNPDLGANTARWSNLWLSGNVYVNGSMSPLTQGISNVITDGVTLTGNGVPGNPVKINIFNSGAGIPIVNLQEANAIILKNIMLGTTNTTGSPSITYSAFLSNANVSAAVAFGFYDIGGGLYGVGLDRNMINFVPVTNRTYQPDLGAPSYSGKWGNLWLTGNLYVDNSSAKAVFLSNIRSSNVYTGYITSINVDSYGRVLEVTNISSIPGLGGIVTTDNITLTGNGSASNPLAILVSNVSATANTIINFSSANAIVLKNSVLGTSNIVPAFPGVSFTSFMANSNALTGGLAIGFYNDSGNVFGLAIPKDFTSLQPATVFGYNPDLGVTTARWGNIWASGNVYANGSTDKPLINSAYLSAVTFGGNANIRITTNTGLTDDLSIVSGANIVVSRLNARTIQIASTGGGGGGGGSNITSLLVSGSTGRIGVSPATPITSGSGTFTVDLETVNTNPTIRTNGISDIVVDQYGRITSVSGSAAYLSGLTTSSRFANTGSAASPLDINPVYFSRFNFGYWDLGGTNANAITLPTGIAIGHIYNQTGSKYPGLYSVNTNGAVGLGLSYYDITVDTPGNLKYNGVFLFGNLADGTGSNFTHTWASGKTDLGTPSARWGNLYLTGNVYVNGSSTPFLGSGNTYTISATANVTSGADLDLFTNGSRTDRILLKDDGNVLLIQQSAEDRINFSPRNSGVISGSYGSDTYITTFNVDQYGRITFVQANSTLYPYTVLSAVAGNTSITNGSANIFSRVAINGGASYLGGANIQLAAGPNVTISRNSDTITISATGGSGSSYTLPAASSSTLGGIKVGTTLSIASEVLNLNSGIVTAGTYGSSNGIITPVITVDTYGRVTSVDQVRSPIFLANVVTVGGSENVIRVYEIASAPSTSIVGYNDFYVRGEGIARVRNSSGNLTINAIAVTSISAGTGISTGGSPITSSGTISLTNSGVAAAQYGGPGFVPQLVVDATGRVTSASNIAVGLGGTVTQIGAEAVNGITTGTAGNVITTSGNIRLSTINASALTLGGGINMPTIYLDQFGRGTGSNTTAPYSVIDFVSISGGANLRNRIALNGGTSFYSNENPLSIVGSGATTVTYDSNSKITISSTTSAYSLPAASASTLGGVKTGGNININASNVIDLTSTSVTAGAYSGGISAITVDTSGRVTSVTGSAGYSASAVTSYNGRTGSITPLRGDIDTAMGSPFNNANFTANASFAGSTVFNNASGIGMGLNIVDYVTTNSSRQFLSSRAGWDLGSSGYGWNYFYWGSYGIQPPTGSSSNFLRADGTWAAPPAGASYTLPNATTTTLGGVIVGAGLSVTSGTISMPDTGTSGSYSGGISAITTDAKGRVTGVTGSAGYSALSTQAITAVGTGTSDNYTSVTPGAGNGVALRYSSTRYFLITTAGASEIRAQAHLSSITDNLVYLYGNGYFCPTSSAGKTWFYITNTSAESNLRWTIENDGIIPGPRNSSQASTANLGNTNIGLNKVWFGPTGSTGTVSDQRVKTDIQNSDLGLAFVNSLRPVKFKGITVDEITTDADGNSIVTPRPSNRYHYGLIAQEVKSALDSAGVGTTASFWGLANKDDPDSQQHISKEGFIAPLIKAIQELSAENQQLKADIAAIKAHLGL